MNTLLFGPLALGAAEWAALFGHFAVLSLLTVGGAMTTVPEMHRYIVGRQRWLDDAQFSASIALAQAAPGPNVLFVAVIGFNVAGLVGVVATLAGTLLPTTALALLAVRLGNRYRQARATRAFTAGLAPLTVGLLLATCWVLLEPTRSAPGAWALVATTVVVMLRTAWSPLWPIAAGAAAGMAGWV